MLSEMESKMSKVAPQVKVMTEEDARLQADVSKTKWAHAASYVVFLLRGAKGSEYGDDFEIHTFAHRSAAIAKWQQLNSKYPTMVDCELEFHEATTGEFKSVKVRGADGAELTYG
jgi:hypothetical protein